MSMTESEYVRHVVGYEGLYVVNALGQIYSVKREKFLVPSNNKFGYPCVCLYKDGKSKQHKVHRIVASAFILNPMNKPQVNHIDGNKENNRVWNLEWCTNRDNQKHAVAINIGNCYKVRIVETGEIYPSLVECAKAIGGSNADISRCLLGKTKTHKGYHFERVVD